MNLVSLRTFLAIIESGSLVRASQRLNVTQSTVTVRLRGLEEAVGEQLLVRDKAGVSLTSAGRRFRRYAEGMIDLWRQARRDVSLPGEIDTQCSLACHIDLWPTLGRAFFGVLWREYPNVSISVWHGGVTDVDEWLGSGLSNAALTYQPIDREGLSPHRLPDETLVMMSDQPGTNMRSAPGYIYVDAGEEFGRRHAAAFTNMGRAKSTFGAAVWALDHLLAHGGTAYLPERLADGLVAAERLFPVSEAPRFTRAVYLITRDSEAENWPWLGDVIAWLFADGTGDLSRRPLASNQPPV